MKKEISNIDDAVRKLLEKDVTYADDDNRLCCRIWIDELLKKHISSTDISAYEFFVMLHKDQITKAGSITRARRKLEEDFVHLRGHSYNKRHKIKTEEVKTELNELKYKHNDNN